MPVPRERRRRQGGGSAGGLDLFSLLIDRLADALCALPADAWEDDTDGSGAAASLAERLAALQAVRTSQTEEESTTP